MKFRMINIQFALASTLCLLPILATIHNRHIEDKCTLADAYKSHLDVLFEAQNLEEGETISLKIVIDAIDFLEKQSGIKGEFEAHCYIGAKVKFSDADYLNWHNWYNINKHKLELTQFNCP